MKHLAFVIWMLGFPVMLNLTSSTPVKEYSDPSLMAFVIVSIWFGVGYWITKIK